MVGEEPPRPATDGPWEGHPELWAVDLPDGENPKRRLWVDNAQDARAIAALPDWIAAHDAQRERAERAEAEAERLREGLAHLEAMATSMSDAMPDWQALSIAAHLLRRRITETRRILGSAPAPL